MQFGGGCSSPRVGAEAPGRGSSALGWLGGLVCGGLAAWLREATEEAGRLVAG
jgi:hypothetical protein